LKNEPIYRQLTAFIVLAVFLVQSLNKSFIIADYYVHTVKYEKNCGNKARPQLKCHGKCQMMKKLKQEEKKDQETPERKSENKGEVPFSLGDYSVILAIPANFIIKNKRMSPQSEGTCLDRSIEIFHPPRAC
jgi:hypothetical protein